MGGTSSTGTEVYITQDNFNVFESAGSKSIFTFTIEYLNGYTIVLGDEVTFYDGTTLIWGGTLKKVDDSSPGSGRIVYNCSCEDYNELVERALVIKGFNETSIEDMVK